MKGFINIAFIIKQQLVTLFADENSDGNNRKMEKKNSNTDKRNKKNKLTSSWMHVSNKDPNTKVFEEVNADLLLTGNVTNNRKILNKAKDILNTIGIIDMTSNRASGCSIEDYIKAKKNFYEEFGGDRIYMESVNNIRKYQLMFTVKILRELYKYTVKDVARALGIHESMVFNYQKDFFEKCDLVWTRLYHEFVDRANKDKELMLERLDNKIYIPNPDDSKSYIVYDLTKPVHSPLRYKIVKKEACKEIIKKFYEKQDEQ
ncbi:hypothetical protein [Peptostreptococcus sp. D1]|uniref:hypothetical protein n=1 Tax=Peptostreptococcus sp. D1 TaxID=72304 RepID=UPI0008ED6A3A|nr:hypothetical protein [Peptostreptococcus sp. D1]SFE86334.1 hypothetical protein SAMN02910278_01907 [Peptostreptococcus sp. D1]